jgi:predicted metalloendopeptidase
VLPTRGRSARLTACVILAALAATSACTGPVDDTASGPGVDSGLDLPGYDHSVRVQDDLYQFANGGWLKSTQIPPDMSEYGAFSVLSQKAEDDQRSIVEAAESDGGAPIDSNERKIGDLYASFMDTAKLEQLKSTPLQSYFATIDSIVTPTDLIRHLGDIQRSGASNPIDLDVSPDAKDATHYIAGVSQGGLSLPDRDYYLSTDPKMSAIRTQYRAYITKMFTLAGQPDAAGAATRIFNLEEELAQAQWTNVHNRDTLATYNKFNLATATKATGLDWANYMAAAGVTDANMVMAQPTYFGALNTLVATTPIPVWKDYLRWHVIQDYAPFLSADFVSARFDFVGTVLGGRPQNRERWRRGVTAVNGAMGDAMGQLYVQKYFPADAKDRAESLIQSIRAAYQSSVDQLDWMSQPSKDAAKDKLDKLAVKIGYPARWKDYSSLRITRDDLVGNLDRAAQVAHQRDIDKLGKPVDRDEWHMTPQTVNAYYNPSLNEIVFPAAILQPPFFDAKADDAVNYGAIGSVIGHEMSHGFDDQGRHYDGDGNLREWMAPADAAKFDAKTQALVAQYNGYQPLPGSKINGALTLGENIADLSGITESYKAYQASLNDQPAPELDGFTGDQRFFLGYGQIWRDKERDESLRSSLLTDPHSPGHFRADGVVPNVDAFYQAFSVKPGDKLYKDPQARIHIW